MFKLKTIVFVTYRLSRFYRLDPKFLSSRKNIKEVDETALKYLATQKWKKGNDPNTSEDAPIKYSTSAASGFKAAYARTGDRTERLWYEPYILIVSLAIFLIYFTILREENDLDRELSMSLYDRIEGLEETQLKLSIAYNKEHGGDSNKLVERLETLKMEKELTKKS